MNIIIMAWCSAIYGKWCVCHKHEISDEKKTKRRLFSEDGEHSRSTFANCDSEGGKKTRPPPNICIVALLAGIEVMRALDQYAN